MAKMTKKEKDIYNEIIEKEDPISILIMMNHFKTFNEYTKQNIDIKTVLIECAKYLKNKKFRIPSGGYINLIENLE